MAPVLIPSQLRADPPVGDDVRAALARRSGPDDAGLGSCLPEAVDDLLTAMAGTDVMVAGRYHGILLSCVAGVPVVATPSQGA